ncbi:glycosyltransferase family 2 protein [Salinivibrio sp. AR640]|uniref:glycosyltransferase family 2 protein n=1 Tax=Salinivibrio sp. AR640 TaxID=1909437 RepID=UPI0009852C8C|nr:glycosyltransferase family 2 protein [Salinivibrio sp. AR640]OOE94681.1 hypothetical protein BZG75_04940 [Salinivibrio sp. AR640]
MKSAKQIHKVSVVLPIYNAQETLEKCLNSLVIQTYVNIEIIAINDGSQDESLSILERFKETDRRIRIVSRSNKGLVYTLNEAISLARGYFIVRMDADDIAFPERISKQVDFMVSNPDILASGTAAQCFGDEERLISKSVSHVDLLFSSLDKTPIIHPSAIIRRSVFSDYGVIYDDKYPHAEDVKLWSDISKVGLIGNIEEVLLMYRVSDHQVSRVYQEKQKESAIKARLLHFEFICDEYEVKKLGSKFLSLDKKMKYRLIRFSIKNKAFSDSVSMRLITCSGLGFFLSIKLFFRFLKSKTNS